MSGGIKEGDEYVRVYESGQLLDPLGGGVCGIAAILSMVDEDFESRKWKFMTSKQKMYKLNTIYTILKESIAWIALEAFKENSKYDTYSLKEDYLRITTAIALLNPLF